MHMLMQTGLETLILADSHQDTFSSLRGVLLAGQANDNMIQTTTIYEDNQGANDLANNPKYHNRTKHIDICHHFVRERVITNEINVVYCPTENMRRHHIRDLASVPFKDYAHMLGVRDIRLQFICQFIFSICF